MAFHLGQALLSLLCLTARSSAARDPCEHLDLFASKTAYSRDLGECLARGNQLFGGQSLVGTHERLLGEQCRPVGLYVVGRHAARQPGEEEIAELERALEEFRGLIEAGDVPAELRDRYLNSRPRFSPRHSNLVTAVGANDHRAFAQRLKAIYPDLFDASRTEVTLATTSKLRTVQSGVEFVKAVGGFQLNLATNGTYADCVSRRAPASYDSEQALDDKCFASVLSKNALPALESHKICKKRIKQELRDGTLEKQPKPAKSSLAARLSEIKNNLLTGIATRLASRLKLASPPGAKVVAGVYDVCRYETSALAGVRSVWCDLLEADELEGLEYLEDANIYHKMAAGRESYFVQSSPVVREILNRLRESSTDASSGRLRAFFGFTHDGVLKKLFAALGFFDADKQAGYTLAELDQFDRTGWPPARRLWRASLMVPFSANVAFALYRCGGGQARVLTSVSERPALVRGCSEVACPLEEFFEAYERALEVSGEQVCQEVRRMMGL